MSRVATQTPAVKATPSTFEWLRAELEHPDSIVGRYARRAADRGDLRARFALAPQSDVARAAYESSFDADQDDEHDESDLDPAHVAIAAKALGSLSFEELAIFDVVRKATVEAVRDGELSLEDAAKVLGNHAENLAWDAYVHRNRLVPEACGETERETRTEARRAIADARAARVALSIDRRTRAKRQARARAAKKPARRTQRGHASRPASRPAKRTAAKKTADPEPRRPYRVDGNGLCTDTPIDQPDPIEIAICERWLQLCCRPAKTFGKHSYSYGLKHDAEFWAGHYVSNGALLVAALSLGYKIKPDGLNADVALRIDPAGLPGKYRDRGSCLYRGEGFGAHLVDDLITGAPVNIRTVVAREAARLEGYDSDLPLQELPRAGRDRWRGQRANQYIKQANRARTTRARARALANAEIFARTTASHALICTRLEQNRLAFATPALILAEVRS